MSIKDIALNVATLGAHQRVKNETATYESILKEYNELTERHEERRVEINTLFEEVIAVKKTAILELSKMKKMTENLNVKQREQIATKLETQEYSLEKIDASLKAGEMAISATKGVFAGASTALGAWALIGTYGVASTGTAISTLSGVAASNAMLAWLGGGSIAAGGGGIAAGTAVLGGLIAVPILAVTGMFQHLAANKKIKELKEEELKIVEQMDAIEKNMLAFEALEKRAKELIDTIRKGVEAFNSTYAISYKALYPLGFMSRFFMRVRKAFIKKMFTDEDLAQIQAVGKAAGFVLKMVDSPVL